VAPVLPGLTDSDEQLDDLLGRIAAAGADGASVMALHLRPGAREWFLAWLALEHPQLMPLYRELYGGGSYVRRAYAEDLRSRVRPKLRRHGLDRSRHRGADADAIVDIPSVAELPEPAATLF
jgi:DNA repair photolyase